MKKYLALKASAGSGKTFALSVRYISLLLLGAKPNEILSLTFTNKAANEMSERIYHTLLNLGNNEVYLSEISNQTNLSTEQILEKKPKIIENFINSELCIWTIDKFIGKILREFCGYLHLSDDFAIKNDKEDELSYKFLQSLNDEDFTNFINFLLYEDKKFGSLFGIFKNLIEKNEKLEFEEIAQSLIASKEQEVLTFAQELKKEITNEKLSTRGQNALDFNDISSLLEKGKTWLQKDSVCEYVDFKKHSSPKAEESFEKLKKSLSEYYTLRSKNYLASLSKLFLKFVEFRKVYLKQKNYLEFSDVSNYVFALQEKIDKDFIYFRLDSKYSHLLIDEFQDTSILQYNILNPMIEEFVSDESEFKTFFYVGDTKQSIYRFRGGKKELFDFVSNKYKNIEVENLDTNYRSCKEIVNFVNEKFKTLSNYEYIEQKAIKKGGFVKVYEDSFEDAYKNIFEVLDNLLKSGVCEDNIAILVYQNQDVLNIYNYLKEKLPKVKITTETSSKLINQTSAKIVINAVKYLYFKENIYKLICNDLLGKNFDEELNFEEKLLHEDVAKIIKTIAEKLGVLNEDILKLIEICSSYKNIVDFIYEIDFLDTSIQNKEGGGIQILTIFKSKGLEFDTVIVCDRIKNSNNSSGSLLFDYDGISLQNIFYKIPNLQFCNNSYKIAEKKEESLSLQDNLNVLYVALTRAKNNLIVLKKEKSSTFDILGLKAYEIGELQINKKEKVEAKLEKITYQAQNLGRQKLKIKQDSSEHDYSLHAKYFGLATHYVLEMINSFEIDHLKTALNLAKTKYGNHLSNDDFEDINQRISMLLKHNAFCEIIKNKSYTKEQSLMFKNEKKIIDLLVFGEDEIFIIDYKTTIDELDTHITQVMHYKKAISEIIANKKVFVYIVYLKKNEVLLKEVCK